MAARTPRRTFANPFVITLAAIPACSGSPPPQQPVVMSHNPPAPAPEPPVTQTDPPPAPTPAPTDPTPAPDPGPQQSKPSTAARFWLVTRNGATCMAMPRVDCPKPVPGEPLRTCNPPPPVKYACPDGLADKATLTVVQYAGATECVVQVEPVKCPPNVSCNPPRPRPMTCPTR